MAVVGQVAIDLQAKSANFNDGMGKAKKSLNDFRAVAKGAADLYRLDTVFSNTASLVKEINPELGRMVDHIGKTITLSKSLSFGKGGLLGLAGGAIGIGLSIYQTIQDQAKKIKQDQDEYNKSMDDLAGIWKQIRNLSDPYFTQIHSTAATPLIAKAQAELDKWKNRQEDLDNSGLMGSDRHWLWEKKRLEERQKQINDATAKWQEALKDANKENNQIILKDMEDQIKDWNWSGTEKQSICLAGHGPAGR